MSLSESKILRKAIYLSQTIDEKNSVRRHQIKKWNEFHVALQYSKFFSKTKFISSDHLRKSLINKYNNMTVLNCFIENHDETTSILKCFSHRLKMQKQKTNNLQNRIEKLTIENKYLRKNWFIIKILVRF